MFKKALNKSPIMPGKSVSGKPLIEFKNVSKSFGQKHVLKSINFAINQGEIFGLIGLSGAGKSTLLKILIGFYKPTSGQILYKGKDISQESYMIRKLFGFSTQGSGTYDNLTIWENLEYFGTLYGVDKKTINENATRLLKLVNLYENRDSLVGNISGGMQRRVDIVCSMIHSPEILILDEPTAGLDPVIRVEMADLFEKINKKEGTTIILISHVLTEIEQLCSTIGILKEGTITHVGKTSELKNLFYENLEIFLQTKEAKYDEVIKSLKSGGLQVQASIDHDILRIRTTKTREVARHLVEYVGKSNQTLKALEIREPPLEEVFAFFVKSVEKTVSSKPGSKEAKKAEKDNSEKKKVKDADKDVSDKNKVKNVEKTVSDSKKGNKADNKG